MKEKSVPEMCQRAGVEIFVGLQNMGKYLDHPTSRDSGKGIKHKRVATFPPPPLVPGIKDDMPQASESGTSKIIRSCH